MEGMRRFGITTDGHVYELGTMHVCENLNCPARVPEDYCEEKKHTSKYLFGLITFEETVKTKPPLAPKAYRIGGIWGDRITWEDYDTRTVVGWKRRIPEIGDYLLCKMESGMTGVFEFKKITYCDDPADMFFAYVEDAGYLVE